MLEVYETPAQRRLALEIARQSMVLLSNNGVLPLPEDDRQAGGDRTECRQRAEPVRRLFVRCRDGIAGRPKTGRLPSSSGSTWPN